MSRAASGYSSVNREVDGLIPEDHSILIHACQQLLVVSRGRGASSTGADSNRVLACPGTYYRGFYFSGGLAELLRPYADTGTALRFYGSPYCGSVEGCGMVPFRYDFMPCGATPVLRSSWGRVKAIYR